MRFGNYHVPDNVCLDVSRDTHIYLENIVINKHDTTGYQLRKIKFQFGRTDLSEVHPTYFDCMLFLTKK